MKNHLKTFKSSRSKMFFKIGVLKNYAIFTGKHLCWNLFLINLQALRCRPEGDSKKRGLNTVYFYKQLFYRTPPMAASEPYFLKAVKYLKSHANIAFIACKYCFPGMLLNFSKFDYIIIKLYLHKR